MAKHMKVEYTEGKRLEQTVASREGAPYAAYMIAEHGPAVMEEIQKQRWTLLDWWATEGEIRRAKAALKRRDIEWAEVQAYDEDWELGRNIRKGTK